MISILSESPKGVVCLKKNTEKEKEKKSKEPMTFRIAIICRIMETSGWA